MNYDDAIILLGVVISSHISMIVHSIILFGSVAMLSLYHVSFIYHVVKVLAMTMWSIVAIWHVSYFGLVSMIL